MKITLEMLRAKSDRTMIPARIVWKLSQARPCLVKKKSESVNDFLDRAYERWKMGVRTNWRLNGKKS